MADRTTLIPGASKHSDFALWTASVFDILMDMRSVGSYVRLAIEDPMRMGFYGRIREPVELQMNEEMYGETT